MLILKEPIPGNDNVLTLATRDMRFCNNKGLNYNPTQSNRPVSDDEEPVRPLKKGVSDESEGDDEEPVRPLKKGVSNESEEKNKPVRPLRTLRSDQQGKNDAELFEIFGSVLNIGVLVAKYLLKPNFYLIVNYIGTS